jgi:hypothetical protein
MVLISDQVIYFCLGVFATCLGSFICYSILLRLIITLFSLDVRNLSPRLQGLVLLDNIYQLIIFDRETSYAASIRTGLSLEELKEQDD